MARALEEHGNEEADHPNRSKNDEKHRKKVEQCAVTSNMEDAPVKE